MPYKKTNKINDLKILAIKTLIPNGAVSTNMVLGNFIGAAGDQKLHSAAIPSASYWCIKFGLQSCDMTVYLYSINCLLNEGVFDGCSSGLEM